MEEQDALDFYKKVIGGRDQTVREITLTHKDGDELDVELHPVERKKLLDQIQRLPDELLEVIAEADDAEEAEDEVDAAALLRGMSGEAVAAFEEICALGLKHPDLADDDFRDMCTQFSFEALFPVGAQVIEISLEDTGVVKDFQVHD